MKVGDLIRIKNPFLHPVGAYHSHLFDEIMIVTEIDYCGMSEIEPIIECVSTSGLQRFPAEDMELIDGSW
ncbi:MAG TPA: hypothetical protein EYF95_05350 [Flavobacteriales bacterium]|jgi:hypothetical protein|nr:hypothetical protein [Flavobacteriales bacterium]